MPILKFLGAGRMLADAVAEELLRGTSGPLPDLGRTAAVVPGRRAVRILEEKLADAAPGGLLAPGLFTPGALLRHGFEEEPAATEIEQLAAWSRVLGASSFREFEQLFPAHSGESGDRPDPRMLEQLGKKFHRLRQELTQGGLAIADLAPKLGERGRELAELERRFLACLRGAGLADPLEVELRAAADTGKFADFDRIVLAGVPDLPKLVRQRLERLDAANFHIEVWIQADPADAEFFDSWGAPVPEKWHDRPFDFGDPAEFLHPVNDPREAAVLAVALAGRSGEVAPDRTAVVLAHPDLFPPFRQEFSALRTRGGEPLDVYDPAGVPVSHLRLYRFGAALLALLENPGFDRAAALLREPDFLDRCADRAQVPPDELLEALDRLALDHLPDTLETARQFASAPLRGALEEVERMLRTLAAAPVPVEALRGIFSGVFFRSDYPPVEGIPFDDEVAELRSLLFRAGQSRLLADCTAVAALRLLLDEFGAGALYAEHPAPSLDLGGFLELPYLPQPEVILCGLNEGWIPEKVGVTPFLTESLRTELGLKNNEARFARDAFYLAGLIASRRAVGGSVHLIALKFGPDGDPMRFSSLLFQAACPEELLERGELCFADFSPLAGEPVGKERHFQIAPRLQCRKADDGTPILSVTDFKLFLGSPLNFALEREEDFQTEDYDVRELDDLRFGSACHAAFERLGRNGFSDPAACAAALRQGLDDWLAGNFGAPLPPLVDLQREQLRQRLDRAAAVFCGENAAFEPIEIEYPLGGEAGMIDFAGMKLKGRIDRIELSRGGVRRLRLLDYKTANQGVEPEPDHRVGRPFRFVNLQLPLYALLLRRDAAFRARHPELDLDSIPIECGYFLLPQNVTDTRIAIWNPVTFDALLPEAEATAVRIGREVRELDLGILHMAPDSLKAVDPDLVPLLRPTPAAAVAGIDWRAAEPVKQEEP